MDVSNPYVGSVVILMTSVEAQDRKEDHQEGRIQVLEARFGRQELIFLGLLCYCTDIRNICETKSIRYCRNLS
ncbi:hypothetical protein CDAR_470721 [Caerostris darwini]|uniref:Uncharacterized protein n=1 Tax=Caerostris darwini TaxID=1538125 RepID=A0AAV4VGX3_9ARAC|nr:hypothetical protein CDAR_470721 [Caerostris darwini]